MFQSGNAWAGQNPGAGGCRVVGGQAEDTPRRVSPAGGCFPGLVSTCNNQVVVFAPSGVGP